LRFFDFFMIFKWLKWNLWIGKYYGSNPAISYEVFEFLRNWIVIEKLFNVIYGHTVVGSKCHGLRASYFQTIPSLVKTSQAVVEFWKWEYMRPPFLSLGIPFFRHPSIRIMEKVSFLHHPFQTRFLGQGLVRPPYKWGTVHFPLVVVSHRTSHFIARNLNLKMGFS
jgi:hypothetical protein